MLRHLSAVSHRQFFSLRFYSTTDAQHPIVIDPQCDPGKPLKLNFAQISSAAYNIKAGIQRTECRRSFKLSHAIGAQVFLKMELNQATGSFKERGARQALLRLNDEQKKNGVWAASAGNHALALCYHGKKLGIPINVVMPRHAPLMKIDFCVKFGANVIVEGKDISLARDIALKSAHEHGAVYINGYDHIDILAGAGTIGLEILDQVNDLDAVIIPVGGGGLIAGVAVAIKTLYPNIQIIGVESVACPSFTKSLEADTPTVTRSLPSLADGLAVPLIGVNAFYTAKDYVDKMVQVNEQSIALAILRLLEWEKVCVEGAGATGIAALMSKNLLPELKGKRVATILTGGNIDSTALGRCIDRGLVYDNRLIRFKVIVSDRPGGISELAKLIADTGASVKDMFMERAWVRQDVFSVNVKVVAETRNKEHVEELERHLRERYEDVCFTQFEQYLVKQWKPSADEYHKYLTKLDKFCKKFDGHEHCDGLIKISDAYSDEMRFGDPKNGDFEERLRVLKSMCDDTMETFGRHDNIANDFVGLWKLERCEDQKEYLKSIGCSRVRRKFYSLLPTSALAKVDIRVDEYNWHIMNNFFGKKFNLVFELRVETPDDDDNPATYVGEKVLTETFDGKQTLALMTLRTGRLFEKLDEYYKNVPKRSDTQMYIKGGKLIVELKCGKTAARFIYKRVK